MKQIFCIFCELNKKIMIIKKKKLNLLWNHINSWVHQKAKISRRPNSLQPKEGQAFKRERKHEDWLIYSRAWAEDWGHCCPLALTMSKLCSKVWWTECGKCKAVPIFMSSPWETGNFYLLSLKNFQAWLSLDLHSGQATCGPRSTARLRITPSHPY